VLNSTGIGDRDIGRSVNGKSQANFSDKILLIDMTRSRKLHQQITRSTGSPNQPISNVMYFETGQGSALSAEAHHGVDQLTLEAVRMAWRACLSRSWLTAWWALSDPEYLYDERQIIRADWKTIS